MKFRFTAKKYGGDDLYSWAVFCNDRVMPDLTGLNRAQARYYVNQLKESKLRGKNRVEIENK